LRNVLCSNNRDGRQASLPVATTAHIQSRVLL
jgi:hypothetical protein